MPRINRRQRNWLMAGLCLVLLMGVFPPFQAAAPSTGFNVRESHHLGYAFLLAPPRPVERSLALTGMEATVDAPVLLFQCFLVFVAIGVGYMSSGGHEAKPSEAAAAPVAPKPSL